MYRAQPSGVQKSDNRLLCARKTQRSLASVGADKRRKSASCEVNIYAVRLA